jgi:hypothetical protein
LRHVGQQHLDAQFYPFRFVLLIIRHVPRRFHFVRARFRLRRILLFRSKFCAFRL